MVIHVHVHTCTCDQTKVQAIIHVYTLHTPHVHQGLQP